MPCDIYFFPNIVPPVAYTKFETDLEYEYEISNSSVRKSEPIRESWNAIFNFILNAIRPKIAIHVF